MSKVTWIAIGSAIGFLIIVALIVWGLYSLGGSNESALEKARDIAIIFIVLMSALMVILLTAVTVTLGYLAFQIKDRVIPLLEELNGTMRRVRGTAEFMSEEAVKPILSVAGTFAKMRAMSRTVSGKDRKP